MHGPSAHLELDQFRAKYGRTPDFGALDDHYRQSGAPTLLRLFFFGGLTMPDDLRARLGTLVPRPAAVALAALDELPEAVEHTWTVYDSSARRHREEADLVALTVRESERAAVQELVATLRLVESGKLAVSDKTRRPTAAGVRLIAEALAGGDFYGEEEQDSVGPIRAFAWPMLVQAAGLAELRGSRLALTRAGVKALGAEPATVIKAAWGRWLATRILDELARVDAIRGQTGKGKRGLTAVADRRETVAGALADCPPGRWVELDELFRYMRAAGHRFEVTRNAWTLYIGEAGYGSLGYDGSSGWNILQARYALCLLFEYAATLGLIDVAYVHPAGARPDYTDLWGSDHLDYLSRYDGLEYLRVTALGAWCLGITDTYEPPRFAAAPAFTILANLELALIGAPLAYADLLVLERYAEQTADRIWRLDRERLLAAVEQGDSVAGVREFLTARAAAPIPATVASLLDDVGQRAERLVDRGPMRVIDCTDPALVALLASDSRTRALCIAAGDDRLLVPSECEPAFRRAVRKLGYAVRAGEQLRKAA
ncbi:MAG: helicase-associated domain-containing protein [Actinomycetota bacterium]|nr:helicase-associated domain-containing protein [Actinomycetota bacterium]